MFVAEIVQLAVVAKDKCVALKCVTEACTGGGGVIAGPIYVGAGE